MCPVGHLCVLLPGVSVEDSLTVPFQSRTCISRLENPAVPSSKLTCQIVIFREYFKSSIQNTYYFTMYASDPTPVSNIYASIPAVSIIHDGYESNVDDQTDLGILKAF